MARHPPPGGACAITRGETWLTAAACTLPASSRVRATGSVLTVPTGSPRRTVTSSCRAASRCAGSLGELRFRAGTLLQDLGLDGKQALAAAQPVAAR